MDVYESKYVIKGLSQSYFYSKKDIRSDIEIGRNPNHKFDVNRAIIDYKQKINSADYNWAWDDYYNEFGNDFMRLWLTNKQLEDYASNIEEQKRMSKEYSELKGYVEDIIIIRNDAEKSKLQISELANYYSKDALEYLDEYDDYDMSSWAVLKQDQYLEGETSQMKKIPVTWNKLHRKI